MSFRPQPEPTPETTVTDISPEVSEDAIVNAATDGVVVVNVLTEGSVNNEDKITDLKVTRVTVGDTEHDAGEAVTVTSNEGGYTAQISISEDGKLVLQGTDAFNALAKDAKQTFTISYDVSGSDPKAYSGSATATVTVVGDNDTPVAGESTAVSTRQGGKTNFDIPQAKDVDGDTLIYGTPTATNGTITVNPDGGYTYTAKTDAPALDTITYTVSDGTATVNGTISVAIAANNPPEIKYAPAQIGQINVLEGADNTTIATNVHVEDAEDGNGTLAISLSGDTGSFTFKNGTLTFNSKAIDYEALAEAQNKADPTLSVTLTATDSNGKSDTETFTVHVTDRQEQVPALTGNNASIDLSASYGGWKIDGHDLVKSKNYPFNTTDNGIDTITGGKGNDLIRGKGANDTINLSAGGSDTVVFESSFDTNGKDTITGFKAGAVAAGGDILDFTAFKGSTPFSLDSTVYSSNPGNGTTLGNGKIVRLVDISGGDNLATADGLQNALNDSTWGSNSRYGEYYNFNATNNGKYIFLTAASANASTISVFFAQGNGSDFSVDLVGTVSGDGLTLAGITAANLGL